MGQLWGWVVLALKVEAGLRVSYVPTVVIGMDNHYEYQQAYHRRELGRSATKTDNTAQRCSVHWGESSTKCQVWFVRKRAYTLLIMPGGS
jgi:hypothetical protein